MPPYRDMFKSGEVVLAYFDEKPLFFARVEEVIADGKKGWWQISLLILTVPLKLITWILNNDQMRGAGFTMNRQPLRIERVESPMASDIKKSIKNKKEDSGEGGVVISLFDDV